MWKILNWNESKDSTEISINANMSIVLVGMEIILLHVSHRFIDEKVIEQDVGTRRRKCPSEQAHIAGSIFAIVLSVELEAIYIKGEGRSNAIKPDMVASCSLCNSLAFEHVVPADWLCARAAHFHNSIKSIAADDAVIKLVRIRIPANNTKHVIVGSSVFNRFHFNTCVNKALVSGVSPCAVVSCVHDDSVGFVVIIG